MTKYRNVPTVYKGRRYHSKAEANYAAHLDLMKKARNKEKVLRWEPQVRIPLYAWDGNVGVSLNVGFYVADFYVTYSDTRHEVHEVKGVETALWKLKQKIIRANYPNLVLKVIKA